MAFLATLVLVLFFGGFALFAYALCKASAVAEEYAESWERARKETEDKNR